jgi:hypothetical protein
VLYLAPPRRFSLLVSPSSEDYSLSVLSSGDKSRETKKQKR